MSKLMYFDFVCDECTHRFEELVDAEEAESTCPECGSTAQRRISPVRLDWLKMGKDPAFGTFADKWARAHEKAGGTSLDDV